jgi:hypothetical protein
MPGWFIHMEAAKLVVDRLKPPEGAAVLDNLGMRSEELGEIGRRWRNYLAVGALGPDLFFLLPDFRQPTANVLLNVTQFLIGGWNTVDELFVGQWGDLTGPIKANAADLASQLTGGLSQQLAQITDELNAAKFNLVRDFVTRLDDWFGELTSGVPQGLGDSGFYWSDMFHYRQTYEFARALWSNAKETFDNSVRLETQLKQGGHRLSAVEQRRVDDARHDGEAQLAFALGWTTHCATDVTGHPFTNAKSGGPFRLHWQRHHLVENHMDAAAYNVDHGGDTLYDELGRSALHFRIAFRTRTDKPEYDGRTDAPAYDYFDHFPAYSVGDTAIAEEERKELFDMDPGSLPPHLIELLQKTMKQVYRDKTQPRVLESAGAFSHEGSGRPSAEALNEMWNVAFRYLRLTSSDGLTPWKPSPPPIVQPHYFPTPPDGIELPEDDQLGGDPEATPWFPEQTDALASVIAIALAIYAWANYIAQVVVWLLTIIPSLALDVLTFLGRELIYYFVVMPVYSLYMASRKLLVYEGFLPPKPEEIDPGLTTLGFSTGYQRQTLIADLNDPAGMSTLPEDFNEPSGRANDDDEFEADPAFPRQTVRDPASAVNAALAPFTFNVELLEHETYNTEVNSQWVAPWQYPEQDLEGDRIGWEPDLTHVGPWLQGDDATLLLQPGETDLDAAALFEAATSPAATSAACHLLFPNSKHLGNPVDYSIYLIERLTDPADKTPDFNLDADRGYAFHCWDFDRHEPGTQTRAPRPEDDFHVYVTDSLGGRQESLDFEQPCTVPEQFLPVWAANDDDARHQANRYRTNVPLHIHYREVDDPNCTDATSIDKKAQRQAGMKPDGSDL